MLKLTSLSSYYGQIKALKNVSLHVKEGEIVSILGANGAGKTTLINSVMGIVRKTEGEMSFNGKNIRGLDLPEIIALGMALVPEGRHLFPEMTVYDNIVLGGYLKGNRGMHERIDKMFDYFPVLRERRKQPAGTLSGGEQQMLAIARALMSEPRLLLLDEPSLGLAPKIIHEIYRMIAGLKKSGTTVVLIEQNARMSLSVSDRAYVLENGSIILSGTAQELSENKEVVRAYLGKEKKDIWAL